MDDRTRGPRLQEDESSQPGPGWRGRLRFLPLLAALAAPVAGYWPALRSPLYADDYLYLRAARDLSFFDYARAALTPYSEEPLLRAVTGEFWRPLYYLSFGLLEPLFGGSVTPYHLVLLGSHLAAVGMVWLLAKELTGRADAAGIAAVLFAAHPAAFEGVAWISSLNNAGLPLMLAAWLVFARATGGERANWPLLGVSALLLALSLGLRESTAVVVASIGVWWLLCRRRGKLWEWRTYAPFLPFAAVGVAYLLLRTRFFTEPAANGSTWDLGEHTPGQSWYYVKVTALPLEPGAAGIGHWLQIGAGVMALAALPALLGLRRWLPAALVAGFLFAIVPYAPLTLTVSPRYVYFPAAFFALAAAAALCEVSDRVRPHIHTRARWPGVAGGLAVVLVAGTASTYDRVEEWSESGPEVHQAWAAELRATYVSLPEGGTLYCANTPLILAIFDSALLGPTVGYYYPGVGAERFDYADLARVQAGLGRDDRIFVAGGR